MKKTLIVAFLFLSACTNNSSNQVDNPVPETPDQSIEVDISKLSSENLDLNQVSGPIVAELDFGSVVSGGEITKILI